jgi:large conductance mechanosensitive channel
MGMIKEFREFALKGNMVDMAVGIIIGGAFGGIVQSLIKDVIMPFVGIAGNVDFANLYVPLKSSTAEAIAAAAAGRPGGIPLDEARAFGPVLAYGNFFTILVNFVILAFVIFVMIKMMNNAKRKFERKAEVSPAPLPETPEDVVLLRQIRDAIQAR